jgi:hypothetical protein
MHSAFYEQLKSMTDNPNVQAVLQDIAREEKTPVGGCRCFSSSSMRNRKKN